MYFFANKLPAQTHRKVQRVCATFQSCQTVVLFRRRSQSITKNYRSGSINECNSGFLTRKLENRFSLLCYYAPVSFIRCISTRCRQTFLAALASTASINICTQVSCGFTHTFCCTDCFGLFFIKNLRRLESLLSKSSPKKKMKRTNKKKKNGHYGQFPFHSHNSSDVAIAVRFLPAVTFDVFPCVWSHLVDVAEAAVAKGAWRETQTRRKIIVARENKVQL